MAEYIEREEYCEKHCRCSNEYCDKESCPIWKALAADVVPVMHGQWIDNGANGYKWAFVCSLCGYVDGHPFDNRHNFCPNCGAKMDGGDNDDAQRKTDALYV